MKKSVLKLVFVVCILSSSVQAQAFAFPLIPIGIKAGVGGMAMLYSTVTGMYIISAATAAYYAGASTFTVLGVVYMVSDILDEDGKPIENGGVDKTDS